MCSCLLDCVGFNNVNDSSLKCVTIPPKWHHSIEHVEKVHRRFASSINMFLVLWMSLIPLQRLLIKSQMLPRFFSWWLIPIMCKDFCENQVDFRNNSVMFLNCRNVNCAPFSQPTHEIIKFQLVLYWNVLNLIRLKSCQLQFSYIILYLILVDLHFVM